MEGHKGRSGQARLGHYVGPLQFAKVPGDQAFRPLKDRLPVSEVTEIELEWYRLQAQQTPH